MRIPPSGKTTFLFTDIEGSTKLSQEFPDILPVALIRHHDILKKSIEANNGYVFKIIGDAFCAAFEKAADAVRASAEIQLKLSTENWNEVTIKVRLGIHTGEAEYRNNDYFGHLTLSRTTRLMSVAYGGQILISDNTFDVVKDEQFKNISFQDLGERRLKDLIKPIRVYQLMKEGLTADFPLLKTLDLRPNNLPYQLTNFIGREKEILKVKSTIEKTNLLTLTGSGGSGKTRLALQVGADLIDEYENGVWLIDLAPLTEETLLIQTVLNTFNVIENPLKNSEEILIEYLKDKEMFIIIDNCEHIIEACSKFTEKILSNCSKIKIIATSREALRCSGEITHRIASLSLPDTNKNLTFEELTQYESVNLFIDRAIAVNPAFKINNENAPALAEICYQLDGIPLAIELAAVRTKMLSLEKIYERLSDRFKLLTGGKRTALPRQQTLKAMIDWSYDLISESEKILWRRLSVFKGGWTLEDAEEICSDENLDVFDILDYIHELTEKSIIIFQEEKDRYRMLETIRQYGNEKSEVAGEMKVLRTKHLKYYINLSENAIPEYMGPKAKMWMDRLEDEHSNIQSALTFSVDEKLYEEGCRLAISLGKYWEIRGYISECISWLEKLMVNPESISPNVFAGANKLAGILNSIRGNYKNSQKYFEAALEIYEKLDDKYGISASLNMLGLNAYDIGDFKGAKVYLEKCLELNKDAKISLSLANLNNSLGIVNIAEGKYNEAKVFIQECIRIARELKDDQYLSIGLCNLADVESGLGNFESAEKFSSEGLLLDRQLGNTGGVILSLINLGMVYLCSDKTDKAKNCFNESLSLSNETENPLGKINSLLNLGYISLMEGNIQNSKLFYSESIVLQKDTPDFKCALNCLAGMAAIKTSEGEHEFAARLAGTIDHAFESTGAVIEKSVMEFNQKTLDTVKKSIGNEKTIEEFNKGKSITLDEAIRLLVS